MSLIPLPYEKKVKNSPRFVIKKLRKKLRSIKQQSKKLSPDQKLINETCKKLERYAKKGNKLNLDQVNDLLKHLERSILSIQKKKRKIVEKNNQNLNKKKKRS